MAKKLQDEDLMLALISTSSQTDAARLLGVTKQTVCNRIKNPAFQKQFRSYRKQILDSANTKLISSTTKAVDVLADLLNSPNEMTRYNASSKILNLVQDYITTEDIIARLDALEEQAMN